MTDNLENLPEIEDQDSDEAAIERQSLSHQKIITRQVGWFMNDALPWTITGLGGAGAIHFLTQSQWLEAIVTFGVTVVVASWTKYSGGFVKTFSTIAGKRGEKDAQLLAQGLGFVGSVTMESLKWRFSPFTNQYLDYQARDCEDLETEGFKPPDALIPMLKDVFVQLRFARPYGEERDLTPIEKREQDETLDIWMLLRRSQKDSKYRQIAIRARGGYGKTTLLQHITLIYGLRQHRNRKFRTAKRVPFLLRLRDYRAELSQTTIVPLPKLIHRHHLRGLSSKGKQPPTPHWAEILLNRGEALVMLDGFDEVPKELREKVSHWITAQMEAYPESTFIVTSRPVAYDDYYAARRPRLPILVQRFTAEQQLAFVQKWYRCNERTYRKSQKVADQKAEQKTEDFLTQLRSRPELKEMGEIPLLLNLLVTYHRNNVRGTLPSQRLELYRGISKLQLEDRPVARGVDMLVRYEQTLEILRSLAWAMLKVESPVLVVPRSKLLDFLSKQPILQREKVQPEEFLKKMVEVGELLVEKEAGEYEFSHASFQGFFGAEAIVRMPDAKAVILGNWLKAKENPVWQEAIPFVTAQLPLSDFAPVIREALKLGPEAVELAAKCLKEYGRSVDPKLATEIASLGGLVKQSRYAKLEQLLNAGEWQEADRETDRVMLEVNEKESGEDLTPDDLKTFPCEDLLTIDRLWVEASNGHFGFSVQKKIWEECDSPMEDNNDYAKFMEKVGWRLGDHFMSYSDLKFSPNISLKGELPICDCLFVHFDEIRISFLAQRLINCNT